MYPFAAVLLKWGRWYCTSAMLLGCCLIPVVTTLIGWGTNVLAVRMLFRPRRPWRLGWWRLQGVIPRRKAALAGSLADVFERELLSNEELSRHVGDLALEDHLEPVIDQRIGAGIDRLAAGIPMASMFLTDALKGTIADQLKTELMGALPEVQSAIGSSVRQTMDLRQLIEEKVRSFSEIRLEELILGVARRELKAIELLGGALGLVIGLLQVGVMLALN